MENEFGYMSDAKTRRYALDTLRAGGVVVLPTDTLHGLSAAASSRDGIRRIAMIKGSTGRWQYILLASSIEMVDRYVSSYGCAGRDFLASLWPAPLTAVLPTAAACPEWCGDTVGIRVPDLPLLLEILEELGEPVVSTSVNRKGEEPLSDTDAIRKAFGQSVDAIVAGPPTRHSMGSTVVDFTGERPEVIRQGDYDWESSG